MPHVSSDHIKRDIRDTRREIDETIDEIGERLHPRHLLDDLIALVRSRFSGDGVARAGSKAGRKSKQFGRTLGHQLREHPVPALLVGAGVTWWLWDSATEDADEEFYLDADSNPESFYADTEGRVMEGTEQEEPSEGRAAGARERVADAKARIGAAGGAASSKLAEAGNAASSKFAEAKHFVSEKTASAGSRAQHAAASTWGSARRGGRRISRGSRRLSHKLGEEIRDGVAEMSEGYHYARSRVEDAIEDYPLAVGTAAFAAGLLLGALIPRSRYEDEWMGSAADEWKAAAKDLGEEAVEKGREVATHTAQAAVDEAQKQGLTPDQLGDKLKNVASKLGDAAKETSREEGLSPSQLKEKASQVAQEAKTTAREEGERASEKLKQSARQSNQPN